MNSKKANRLFLSVVLLHFVLVALLVVSSPFFSLGITGNLLVSQMIILCPALITLVFGKEKLKACDLGFRKVRISTLLLVALYTLLCMPLVTVVNAISMLFVDNTVVAMSNEILELPFVVALVLIAVFGPFCEELVFRGFVFNGYKKDGNTLGAVLLSAIVFGFMHMNFNQAGYAFVIGIALAFAYVATDSIWSSVVMHFIINAQSTCMMYLSEWLLPGSMAQEAQEITKNDLLVTIGIYSIVAAITTVLAICLLIFIADREGRKECLHRLLIQPEESKNRVTPALIVALILAFLYMVLEVMLVALA